jgi:MFS family permease
VAVVLHETPERIGIAQTAAMGPAVLFMLWGGAIADRGDGRRLLAGYLALATLPPLALAAAVGAGVSGYGVVLLYGAALGSLSAFAMPTQDALLSQVVGANLPRAVAVASTMQFVFRLLGTAAAGLAAVVGTIGVLSGQAAVLALGALTVLRIPASRAGAGPRIRPADARERVFAGLGEAVRDQRILPVLVATAAVGVLYVGAFLVIMPLLVRDAFHGGSGELALLNLCFWGGTLASTVAQIRLRPIRRPGRAIVTALTAGAVILAAMAWAPSLAALASLCLVWGMGAGVAMTQSRTVVQIAAPATHRARLLAALQLGLTGGGPVGALATGYLAGMVGPRQAVLYPAATMIAVLVVLLSTTRVWSQEAAAG